MERNAKGVCSVWPLAKGPRPPSEGERVPGATDRHGYQQGRLIVGVPSLCHLGKGEKNKTRTNKQTKNQKRGYKVPFQQAV